MDAGLENSGDRILLARFMQMINQFSEAVDAFFIYEGRLIQKCNQVQSLIDDHFNFTGDMRQPLRVSAHVTGPSVHTYPGDQGSEEGIGE